MTRLQRARGTVVALVALLLAVPAFGETPSPRDRQVVVDRLLALLRAAPGEDAAHAIEDRLIHAWVTASTPAVTLLMSRGLRDLGIGALDDAIEAFTDAIVLDPSLAEAWHRRAMARQRAGDGDGAVRDIQESLIREPRNFSTLRTLSEVAASRGDWKGALAAWEKVLELDPKTPDGDERLHQLRRKAFGDDA